MEEQKLEIIENEKNGKVYKNLNLKSRLHKGIKGLDDGNYVIVEKQYAEGYEFVSPSLKDGKGNPVVSYSCRAFYGGEDVSFWLSEKEHEMYKEAGGVGDNVKILLNKEPYVNPKTGAEMMLQKLAFAVE